VYNSVGRLVKVIQELDGEDLSGYSNEKVLAETIYNYDPNGNLIEVISPEGYLTVFKYDDANRRIKSILYQPQKRCETDRQCVLCPFKYKGEEHKL